MKEENTHLLFCGDFYYPQRAMRNLRMRASLEDIRAYIDKHKGECGMEWWQIVEHSTMKLIEDRDTY